MANEIKKQTVYVPVKTNEDYALAEYSLREGDWKIGAPLSYQNGYFFTEQQLLDFARKAHYAGWYNGMVNAYKHEFSWGEFAKTLNLKTD